MATAPYLLGEAVLRVGGHARGHVEDGFHVGGSVVGCCEAGAAVPLEAAHEAAVGGQVHLETDRQAHRGGQRVWKGGWSVCKCVYVCMYVEEMDHIS